MAIRGGQAAEQQKQIEVDQEAMQMAIRHLERRVAVAPRNRSGGWLFNGNGGWVPDDAAVKKLVVVAHLGMVVVRNSCSTNCSTVLLVSPLG